MLQEDNGLVDMNSSGGVQAFSQSSGQLQLILPVGSAGLHRLEAWPRRQLKAFIN